MNTDPLKSAQGCGCDEGANYKGRDCKKHKMVNGRLVDAWVETTTIPVIESHVTRALANATTIVNALTPMPGSAQWRKERPLYSGCIAYFPDALMEVAHVSYVGNVQHNGVGTPLRWAKEKSADHLDAAARHMADHSKNPVDTDTALHLAKNAWRALAELQTFLENRRAAKNT